MFAREQSLHKKFDIPFSMGLIPFEKLASLHAARVPAISNLPLPIPNQSHVEMGYSYAPWSKRVASWSLMLSGQPATRLLARSAKSWLHAIRRR